MPRGKRKVKRYWKPVKKVRPVKEAPVVEDQDFKLSPQMAYIMGNADSGLSRQELVDQFHEYDCEGEEVESLGVIHCTACDWWVPIRDAVEATDV